MIEADNKTLWCGNLSEQVTEELLYELFLQAGPLEKVRIAKDREGRQKSFAFITYSHEVSVPYAINLFRGTSLFNRKLTLQCRGILPLLPPPIRCYGPDPSIDFTLKPIVQKFTNMTENMHANTEQLNEDSRDKQRESNDKLVMASLQGNWTHRHHPYRAKDQPHNRDNYRPRDNYGNHRAREKPTNNWRDRRRHKNSDYHR